MKAVIARSPLGASSSITLNRHFSRSQHTDSIIKKELGRGMSVSRESSPHVPPAVTNMVISSLVLTHLEYYSVVWPAAKTKAMPKLQKELLD